MTGGNIRLFNFTLVGISRWNPDRILLALLRFRLGFFRNPTGIGHDFLEIPLGQAKNYVYITISICQTITLYVVYRADDTVSNGVSVSVALACVVSNGSLLSKHDLIPKCHRSDVIFLLSTIFKNSYLEKIQDDDTTRVFSLSKVCSDFACDDRLVVWRNPSLYESLPSQIRPSCTTFWNTTATKCWMHRHQPFFATTWSAWNVLSKVSDWHLLCIMTPKSLRTWAFSLFRSYTRLKRKACPI